MSDHEQKTPNEIQPATKRRLNLLGSVDSLLKFYVLALLIVETFLGATLVGAKLESGLQETCVWLGVGMFAIVVVLVFLLAMYSDEPLTRKDSQK